MFSYILGELLQNVNRIEKLNEPIGSEKDLDKFILVLKHFNNQRSIDQKLQQEIRSFIKNMWQKNKNNFNLAYADQCLYDQLPSEVQTKLYTEFLFNDFMYQFRRFFSIRKPRLDEIYAQKEKLEKQKKL